MIGKPWFGPPLQRKGKKYRFDDSDNESIMQLRRKEDKKMNQDVSGITNNLIAALKGKLTNAVDNRQMTKEERENRKYQKIVQDINTKLHKLQPYFDILA